MKPKLLNDEPYLVVDPYMSKILGVDSAIFLQIIHSKTHKEKFLHNGKSWVKIGHIKLLEEMPFISNKTLNRIKKQLYSQNILCIKNLNHVFSKKRDESYQIKWMSINYNKLAKITKIDVRNLCV